MESEKVKEIKEKLQEEVELGKEYCLTHRRVGVDDLCDILTLINELESENKGLQQGYIVKAYDKLRDENKQLRIANKLYAVELGKKDKKEYENLITDIRLEMLKDFREKYKEALKEAVKGENVDCFVESLKIFDKTIEEKICDLK